MIPNDKVIPLINTKVGQLTILGQVPDPNNKNRTYVNAICDCVNTNNI